MRLNVAARVASIAAFALCAAASTGCNSSTATAAASPSSQPMGQFPAATVAALNTAITNIVTQFKAPGAIVGIWFPGEGTYVAADGLADIATGAPMTTNMHMRIGSITKTVTVTLLLQYADEKLLTLDDPVSKYVSHVPNGQNITLRMLANMTSGLFSYTKDEGWIKEYLADPEKQWDPLDLVKIALKHKPNFDPGKGWE